MRRPRHHLFERGTSGSVFSSAGIVLIAGAVDLDMADLRPHGVIDHLFVKAVADAAHEDVERQSERDGQHGQHGTPPVSPDIAPCHLPEEHRYLSESPFQILPREYVRWNRLSNSSEENISVVSCPGLVWETMRQRIG